MKNVRIILAVLVVSVLTACFNSGESADEFMKKVVAAINSKDYKTLWTYVAEEDKAAISQQLSANLANPLGQTLLTTMLGVPEDKLSELTPEQYFVILLNLQSNMQSTLQSVFSKSKTAESEANMEVINIEKFGNAAIVHYKRGNIAGTQKIIKQNGKWCVRMELN